MAGLYIHIPFCHSKCSYCDFYSTPDRRSESAYVGALLKELSMRRDEIGDSFSTLYIGGGTPSVLSPDNFSRLIDGVSRFVDIASLSEFTVEANPEDVDDLSIARYMANGVNRISIGVQTFDDPSLKLISRVHDAETARRALRALKDSGLNFSADLIFGLPGQSLGLWGESLDELLSWRPPHFSSYLLSVEPGTRMYAQLLSGKITEATDEVAGAMYRRLIETARQNGYDHYEISNYALPGRRARHNSAYWDMTPYLGLGVSAHSFDGVNRRYNPSSLRDYLSSIDNGKICAVIDEEDENSRFNDLMITALRTSRGLDMDVVARRFPSLVDKAWNQARRLIAGRLLHERDNTLFIAEDRWLVSDAVMREMIL